MSSNSIDLNDAIKKKERGSNNKDLGSSRSVRWLCYGSMMDNQLRKISFFAKVNIHTKYRPGINLVFLSTILLN